MTTNKGKGFRWDSESDLSPNGWSSGSRVPYGLNSESVETNVFEPAPAYEGHYEGPSLPEGPKLPERGRRKPREGRGERQPRERDERGDRAKKQRAAREQEQQPVSHKKRRKSPRKAQPVLFEEGHDESTLARGHANLNFKVSESTALEILGIESSEDAKARPRPKPQANMETVVLTGASAGTNETVKSSKSTSGGKLGLGALVGVLAASLLGNMAMFTLRGPETQRSQAAAPAVEQREVASAEEAPKIEQHVDERSTTSSMLDEQAANILQRIEKEQQPSEVRGAAREAPDVAEGFRAVNEDGRAKAFMDSARAGIRKRSLEFAARSTPDWGEVATTLKCAIALAKPGSGDAAELEQALAHCELEAYARVRYDEAFRTMAQGKPGSAQQALALLSDIPEGSSLDQATKILGSQARSEVNLDRALLALEHGDHGAAAIAAREALDEPNVPGHVSRVARDLLKETERAGVPTRRERPRDWTGPMHANRRGGDATSNVSPSDEPASDEPSQRASSRRSARRPRRSRADTVLDEKLAKLRSMIREQNEDEGSSRRPRRSGRSSGSARAAREPEPEGLGVAPPPVRKLGGQSGQEDQDGGPSPLSKLLGGD